MSRSYWLAAPGGSRTRIRAGGVVIGRAPGCDLVIDAPAVSRVQAIVHLGADGATLAVLGQAAVNVNQRAVARACALTAGDSITIEGRRFDVVADDAGDRAPSMWMLRDGNGQLFGVARTPFAIGGEAGADLCVAGWPAAVVRLLLADQLHVEAVEPVQLGGDELEPGEIAAAPVGTVIAYRGATFTVVAGGLDHVAVTTSRQGPPDRVALEFLPRGGRLSVGWADHERLVYLPDRRCDLVALLLQPPAPHAPGELIPDEIVLNRLWPGQTRSRSDLNVVIHRVRADLVRAELDARLVQRATGGRATRFDVDPSTRITVL